MTKQAEREIERALNEAVQHRFNSEHVWAFDSLYLAVSLLFNEVVKQDKELSRAANTASCLANGIKPD